MPTPIPFAHKTAPVVYPSLPAAVVVEEPIMELQFPGGCGEEIGVLLIHQMPTMDREPEILPDVPGGGESYIGGDLEYLDMGISPATAVDPLWSGRGGDEWDVYMNGVLQAGTLSAFDGQVGPITYFLAPPPGGWRPGAGRYTFQLKATYRDRPEFRDFWINDPTAGVFQFGPPEPPLCGCIGCPSVLWDTLFWWDPWVNDHHTVSDVLGPTDRHGNYLPLTGPWGSDVPKQHLKTSFGHSLCLTVGVQDGSAFASSFGNLVETTVYPEISYPIESAPQPLSGCPTTGFPIFNQTQGIKVGT